MVSGPESALFLAVLAQMITAAARGAYRGVAEPDSRRLIAANEVMTVVSATLRGVVSGYPSYSPSVFFQVLREKAATHFGGELEWAIASAVSSLEGSERHHDS